MNYVGPEASYWHASPDSEIGLPPGSWPDDVAQQVGLAVVAYQVGVALSVAVLHPVGLIVFAGLDQQIERRFRGHRLPQDGERELPPIHRDQLDRRRYPGHLRRASVRHVDYGAVFL